MQPSKELCDLAVYGVQIAYGKILGTDGPLHPSFTVCEDVTDQRRMKEHANFTTDQDIVAIVSLPGAQRYARIDSGTMNGETGPIPILIAYAAERGDPESFVFVLKFVAGRSPRFSELDGSVQSMPGQDNLFRYAPFSVHPRDTENVILLQEALAKFAKRLFGEAFQDNDPQVSMVLFYFRDGEETAIGSCCCWHRPSETMVKAEFEYRQNIFSLKQLTQLNQTGLEEPIDQEFGDHIMRIYGVAPSYY